ncbi:hypothetical protein HPP92_014751, partial [Vanilla planifolia]
MSSKLKTFVSRQRPWTYAGLCHNGHIIDGGHTMDHEESLFFGPVSEQCILGFLPQSNVEEEEKDRYSSDNNKRGIRVEAYHIFQILQQDGPGFNSRGALDELEVKVSIALVREVLLRILRSINNGNKQRSARLAYKFFMWAGQQQGYKHTPNAYNLTMKIFAESEEFGAMCRLVVDMTQNGLPVTPRTFNVLFCSCSDASMARQLVERFISFKSFNYRPYKHCFNAILHSLIIACQYRLVEWVYQQMLLKGHQPDVLTYNLVLCAKLRLGKFDHFHSLLDEMQNKDIMPDIHTYNLVLHVLGKGGNPGAAVDMLNYMENAGCQPSVLHFTNLIDGLSRAGHLDACKYFFDEMKNKGFQPDVVCYTVMISSYIAAGEFEKAKELFDQMRTIGQVPNVFTYNSMIRGLCVSGKFDDACSMLRDMEVKGCNPNFSVYCNLVSRLRRAGKFSKANEKNFKIGGHMMRKFEVWRKQEGFGKSSPNLKIFYSSRSILKTFHPLTWFINHHVEGLKARTKKQ